MYKVIDTTMNEMQKRNENQNNKTMKNEQITILEMKELQR